jgi:hypothetical protein
MEAMLQEALIELIDTILSWQFFFKVLSTGVVLGLILRAIQKYNCRGVE